MCTTLKALRTASLISLAIPPVTARSALSVTLSYPVAQLSTASNAKATVPVATLTNLAPAPAVSLDFTWTRWVTVTLAPVIVQTAIATVHAFLVLWAISQFNPHT